jgi:hypothetical protein
MRYAYSLQVVVLGTGNSCTKYKQKGSMYKAVYSRYESLDSTPLIWVIFNLDWGGEPSSIIGFEQSIAIQDK